MSCIKPGVCKDIRREIESNAPIKLSFFFKEKDRRKYFLFSINFTIWRSNSIWNLHYREQQLKVSETLPIEVYNNNIKSTHPDEWCYVRAYVWPPHIFASCSWWPLPHSLCSPRQWSSQIVHLRTGWKRGGPLEFGQTRYEQTRRGQHDTVEVTTQTSGLHQAGAAPGVSRASFSPVTRHQAAGDCITLQWREEEVSLYF